MKPSKCLLCETSLEYLGHQFSLKSIEPLTSKISVVQSWPSPASIPQNKMQTEVKRFLGLLGYYRWFICNESSLLYPLLKKNSSLIWTIDHDNSFQCLKAALTSISSRCNPMQFRPWHIYLQHWSWWSFKPNSRGKRSSYRILSDSEIHYCITKRESLGVIKVV
jgi:hypothetical protein